MAIVLFPVVDFSSGHTARSCALQNELSSRSAEYIHPICLCLAALLNNKKRNMAFF